MPTLTLHELAERIGATLQGDGTASVHACAPIDLAGPDEVTFLANAKYARYLAGTRAAGVILGPDAPRPEAVPCLVAEDPYFAFRQAMIEFHGFRQHPRPMDERHGDGVSPRAAVHPQATLAENVVVHPFVTVEAGATVGRGTILYPNVYVGPDASVGEDCVLHPGVVVYDRCRVGDRVTLHANTVIGQDGFGYATHRGEHHKIPQAGVVVIEDDVEMGAACAVERAAMGETRVGKGTKFADLISIGHGTAVGEHCLFVSLVGVSGSVEVGNHVVLGGQVGVAGHLKIGDAVQAAGRTAIVHDVPPGRRVGGMPAVELAVARRNALAATGLADMAKTLRALERRLAQLESPSPPKTPTT